MRSCLFNRYIIIAFLSVTLSACGGDPEVEVGDDDDSLQVKLTLNAAQSMTKMLPSTGSLSAYVVLDEETDDPQALTVTETSATVSLTLLEGQHSAQLSFEFTDNESQRSWLVGRSPVQQFLVELGLNSPVIFSASEYDTSFDNDDDGVSNLDELINGTDPDVADSQDVNRSPTLVRNAGLTVDEGAIAVISSIELQVVDEDNNASELFFTVDTFAEVGQLFLGEAQLQADDRFSQQDIDQGALHYVHDGSETRSDSFLFSVSDGLGGVIGSTLFEVTINPVNDRPVIDPIDAVNLVEGGVSMIDVLSSSDVDNPPEQLVYEITAAPAFGQLEVEGEPADAFTQADIDAGNVRYVHDDSNNSEDQFSFVLNDGAGGVLDELTVLLTVELVDDDAPVSQASIPGGAFTDDVVVDLSCDDGQIGSGCAVIHYTLDGSEPTLESAVFTESIAIVDDVVLKTMAVDVLGNTESPAQEFNFFMDITTPTTTVDVPGMLLFSPVDVSLACTDGAEFNPLDQMLAQEVVNDIEVGDVDRDGDVDVVMARDIGSMGNESGFTDPVFKNNGQGLLSEFDTVGPFGLESGAIAMADFDGDLHLDVAVIHAFGELTIFTNNGEGQYTVVQEIFLNDDPRDIAAGDLDGDGDIDLAVSIASRFTSGSLPQVVFYLNTNGVFELQATFVSTVLPTEVIKLADLNNDNALDLLLNNGIGIDILLNVNDGLGFNFADHVSFDSSIIDLTMEAADMNGDTFADLVVGAETMAYVAFNQGAGTFTNDGELQDTTRFNYDPDTYTADTYGLAIADLDGDGDLDVVSSADEQPVGVSPSGGGTLRVWINNGKGYLTDSAQSFFQPDPYASIKVVDMDNDGDADLVTPDDVMRNDEGGSGCNTIFYTVDGSRPTQDSPQYTGPITIFPGTLLNYFAVDNAGNEEPVRSQHYVTGDVPL